MKPSAYYLRGLLYSLQVEGEELQEGYFIDHLIIGVEQEKPITYLKEVVEEYKLNCNPFKYRIIINSLVDDLKEYLLLW